MEVRLSGSALGVSSTGEPPVLYDGLTEDSKTEILLRQNEEKTF